MAQPAPQRGAACPNSGACSWEQHLVQAKWLQRISKELRHAHRSALCRTGVQRLGRLLS